MMKYILTARACSTGKNFGKFMKKLILLAALASTVSASAFASTNLVTNGSFESDILTAGTSFDTGSAQLPSLTDWTVTGSVQLVTSAYGNLTAADGNQWVDLTGFTEGYGKGVSTSIATTAGNTYTLSFDLGTLTGRGASTVAVGVTGLYTQNITNAVMSPTTNSMNWVLETVTFEATTNNTSLSFIGSDANGGNSTLIGLDNVSVMAVPEPESYAMILAGIGMLGLIARRKHV